MALTQIEKDSIRTFVKEQYLNGNWQKVDSFCHFGLSDPADALHDWKRGTPLVNNGTAHIPKDGREFNGSTSWIDSMYSPGLNGNNIDFGDVNVGVFIKKHSDSAGNETLLSAHVDTLILKLKKSSSQIRYSANGDAQDEELVLNADNFYSTDKQTLEEQYLRRDGLIIATSDITTFAVVANDNIEIGREVGGSDYFGGVMSAFVVSASVGFIHHFFSDAVRKLNGEIENQ